MRNAPSSRGLVRLAGAALALAALLCLPFQPCLAADAEMRMPEMVVNATRVVTPTMSVGDRVSTGTRVTEKGMDIQGGKAETSVYHALHVIPGVNVEGVDPFGLAAEQNYVRTRGVRGYLGSLSVEGVPNWGGNPIGPREYLYDTNNFDGVTIYKGVVPADIGTGVGARGGAIELHPRWPGMEQGFTAEQALGSNAYRRTYLRFDSGAFTESDTRLSAAFSTTAADKWKGPGDLGPRNNVNLMLTQPLGGEDDLKLFFNGNHIDNHLYRPLSHDEVEDLPSTYGSDYNRELTGKRAEDIYYYGYNRSRFDNNDLMALLGLDLSDTVRLTLKPYYAREDSTVYQGTTSGGGMVQQRTRDVERYGATAESSMEFADLTLVAGYLHESNDMQITTKNYMPGSLNFLGYGVYTKSLDNGHLHSPFAKVSGGWGDLNWQAGLKYFYYKDPATHGYTSTAANPHDLVRAEDLDRKTKEYQAVLPTVGLSYGLADWAEPFASYGRTQIRPYSYVPLINTYRNNRAAFQAAGVTLDEMFQGYDMEITDTVEVGARLRFDGLELTPTLYATESQNLLVTVYDPRVQLDYQQNVGDATGYGAEVDASYRVNDMVTLFACPSYSVLTYDHDLSFQGSTLDTKGNQVVDTPTVMAKAGVILNWEGLEVAPTLRYVGGRWGDAQHTEKVTGYTVMDLQASYTFHDVPHAKSVRLSLDLTNLLGREYVSTINTSDDSRAGNRSYLVGAPFAALLSLAVDF